MNKKYLAFIGIALVAVLALVFAASNKDQLGQDFAGGQLPTNLLTGADSPVGGAPGYVSPVGGLALLAPGGIGAGGTAANNQITVTYTGVVVWPLTATTIGSSSLATAATTTQVGFTSAGFAVGDPCEVEYTGTTSTLLVSANVTAVNGNAVTSTVDFLNTTGASVTVAVTSTVTGVSSTLKTTCFHAGV
jgi:hypothetical protein